MLRKCVAIALALLGLATQAMSAEDVVTLQADRPGPVISKYIFGQFAEHLGEGVYGGIWVGPDSPIPNVRGIRTDVVRALRAIKVPVVRWPGGCFADKYHWREGIGPAPQRRKRINVDWGGVIEPNTFGTHEFLDFVEQIDSEAYVSVNLGSGTVQEAADWFEYMTTDKPTSLGLERIANGRTQPWRIRFVGFGNESWGCGGAFSAEAYVERMKQFSAFVVNLNPAQAKPSIPEFLAGLDPDRPDFSALQPGPLGMQRIAVGPDGANIEYTEAVMKAWKARAPFFWGIEGISLHSYTFGRGFPMSSPSTDFGIADYAALLKETMGMERLIATHSAIMDRYDPEKQVALVVDEWGAWLKPVAGSNPVFLRQQNSMRDAILAALNLNIFARHADRVRMANIAQMVNVIQSMILTDGNRMLLTPTYHVYRLYTPFQNATSIPVTYQAGEYREGTVTLPRIDAIAARDREGRVWLALTNLDARQTSTTTLEVHGTQTGAAVGEVLTASRVDATNTFEKPATVSPRPIRAEIKGGRMVVNLPPNSVTVLELR